MDKTINEEIKPASIKQAAMGRAIVKKLLLN